MRERLQISFQNDKLPNPFILKGFGFFSFLFIYIRKNENVFRKSFQFSFLR